MIPLSHDRQYSIGKWHDQSVIKMSWDRRRGQMNESKQMSHKKCPHFVLFSCRRYVESAAGSVELDYTSKQLRSLGHVQPTDSRISVSFWNLHIKLNRLFIQWAIYLAVYKLFNTCM